MAIRMLVILASRCPRTKSGRPELMPFDGVYRTELMRHVSCLLSQTESGKNSLPTCMAKARSRTGVPH